MKKVLLAGAIFGSFLVYNCGGGGGGTVDSTSNSQSLDAYLTDAPIKGNQVDALEVKLYKVELCGDNECGQSKVIFENQNGITLDLTKLEGTLHYLGTIQVPNNTYKAVRLEISQQGTVSYQGNVGSFTVQGGQNVNCDGQKCYVLVQGNINPAQNNKLLIDFDLKNFQLDCDTQNNPLTCTIQNMTIRLSQENPQSLNKYKYKFEVYTVINPSQLGESITININGKQLTANISPQTVCEIMDMNYIGGECLTQLQNMQGNVCLELKLSGDPAQDNAQLQVIKMELKRPKECGEEGEEYNSGEEYMTERKMKMRVSPQDIQINGDKIIVNGEQIEITQNTYCEVDTEQEEDRYYIGRKCIQELQNLPQNAMVKIKYIEQGGRKIALEIDVDMEESMEWEEYTGNSEYDYEENQNQHYEIGT